MKIWSVARKEFPQRINLGLGFIIMFLILSSFISCNQKRSLKPFVAEKGTQTLTLNPGQQVEFLEGGTWFKAEKVRYLNIIDSTIRYPTDTIKVKLKSGHLEPYNIKVVIVQDSSS